MSIRMVRFQDPRELEDYGFDGATAIRQEGTPSGFLLPWMAIDAERDRRVKGGLCQLVVSGEFVDDDRRISHPIIEVNPAWMRARGYTRESHLNERGLRVYGPWSLS